MPRVEDGDDALSRLPLRPVHRRRVRVGEVAKLRVVMGEHDVPAPGNAEREGCLSDAAHLRLLAVDEAAARVISCPAKALALADLESPRLVELEPVADVALWNQVARPAIGMDEQDALLGNFGHGARVPRADPVPEEVTVKERNVALAPVPRIALLRPGEAEGDQCLDLERASAKNALGFKTLAHRVVDFGSESPGGCKERGLLPRFGGEPEPEPGRRLAERLGGHLVKIPSKPFDRLSGRPLDHVEHRGPEVGVALPPDLVHERGRHPRELKLPERLARLDAPKLAGVANEDEPRGAQSVGYPQKRPRLRGARERHLVNDEDGAAVLLSQRLERFRTRDAVRDFAALGEEPLQGPAAKTGLAGEHPRRRCRRGESDHPASPGERHYPAEHRRLAGPGVALHADRAATAGKNESGRFALSCGEAFERPLRDGPRDERLGRPDSRLHPFDDFLLGVDRPRGGPGLAHATPDCGDEMLVPHELRESRLYVLEGMDPGRVRERDRQRVAHREDRRALLELSDGPPRDFERRRGLRVPHPDLAAPLLRDPPLASNIAPKRLELLASRLVLASSGEERRGLRRAHVVAPALVPDEVEDLAPAAREALERLPRPARDLETRHPADHGGPERKARLAKPARELVSVEGADEPLRAGEESDFGAPPPSPAPGHVRDDAVRVELRIVVAARHVLKRRRYQPGRTHLRRAPEGRVPPPGPEEARLDELERRADGRVVGAKGAGRARPPEQRLERDRLWRRERDVHPRAMLVRSVANTPEADLRPRHIPLEDPPEITRLDMTAKTQRRSPPAPPMARLAVLVVLPGVVVPTVVLGCDTPTSVPVAAEVMHRGRC